MTGLQDIQHSADPAPAIADVAHLKPRDLIGFGYLSGGLGLAALSVFASLSGDAWFWCVGQVLLAVNLLQWFSILHEAGHKTLFRTVWANKLAGHVASYFALIPFASWRAVHGIHHHWTGWQDLDVTTASLVPRPLSRFERLAVNVSWRLWIPLFSILYRTTNYWNLAHLFRLFPRRQTRWRIVINILLLIAAYGLTASLAGIELLVQTVGVGLVLSLMMQDLLILSQHTHIPMEHSRGRPVVPFAPVEQQRFTRSLAFPRWFACLVLIHLNDHELHHMYSQVPGYLLDRIHYAPGNAIAWWRWLWRAKQMPGEVFLFQNRYQTGFDL